jgi:hypothetical protein
MDEKSNQEQPRTLTVNDPVEKEVVQQLAEMERARMQLVDRNAYLDLEKDRTLGALRGLEAQHRKIYEKILLTRGLDPTTVVQIDEDGKIEVMG